MRVDGADNTVKKVHLSVAIALAAAIGLVSAIAPDTSGAITRSAFLWLIIGVVLYAERGAFPQDRLLTAIGIAGLLFRIPLALAHIAVSYWVYGGEVDLSGFYTHGVRIGREFLEGRFDKAFFGFEYTTGNELAVAVVHRLSALIYLFVGPSVVGMSLASGLVGFLGCVLFLRAYQTEFPAGRDTRFLALCLFLFPGLAFWSSLLGKDSWMLFFLGWLTYSVARLLKAPQVRHLCGLVISLLFIVLIRAATAPVLAAAGGAALLLTLQSRIRPTGPAAVLRPVAYLSWGAIAVGMVAMSMSAAPRQAGFVESAGSPVDQVLALAVHRHVGLARDPTAGGSSLAAQITEPTVSAAIQYLPLGIFTFLFRPLVFEAHNTLAFAAAVDGTVLALLVLWRWRHLVAAVRAGLSSPVLGFCWTMFLLLLAGLAFEANFGVIVRHRIMVLPFLFLFLAVPRTRDVAETATGRDSASLPLPVR